MFSNFFFGGSKCNIGLIPKEGIDPKLAWRHISCVMGTYSIKQEHKEAGCAYLFDAFFVDALEGFKYTPGIYKSLITGETVEVQE